MSDGHGVRALRPHAAHAHRQEEAVRARGEDAALGFATCMVHEMDWSEVGIQGDMHACTPAGEECRCRQRALRTASSMRMSCAVM